MTRFRVINRPEGIALEVNITANIDYDILETLKMVQQKIYNVLDHATALNMLRIDVTVKNVMINGEVFP
ncbi:MAG TPA: hypothetical protein PLS36_07255 [Clostridia bacterium]|nr:hypothetical protein [Clostridia bacterium]